MFPTIFLRVTDLVKSSTYSSIFVNDRALLCESNKVTAH